MSADKSKAAMLADSAHLGYRVQWQREAAAELRRIPALEAERDKYKAHIEAQTVELDRLIPMAEALEAERDQLRADLDALRDQIRAIGKARDRFGWSPEVDEVIEAARKVAE